MKVVVTSDNHGIDCLNDIAMLHNDASYFFHCGDSLMTEKELGEYISVRGNCDYDHDLPLFRIIDVEDHKILLIHGHRYLEHYDGKYLLANLAKSNGCDIVFFGHSHIFSYDEIDGVTLINPGSLRFNRNEPTRTYALVYFEEGKIRVEKMYYGR